ncbi:uncharacterized protein LOC126844621 [Adelges cooleyi]|uniref:uncharacterized protein LOC126844621 n=1 Tax=Adelges cooleyi TaxID=133065 RepID=UPI00217F2AC1|nr:uncharacterized protein LOC126844621 [Adelges cooleyi]
MADEDVMPENDYLMSVLNMLNGYCIVNLEVPQTSSFYTHDSLLPINSKRGVVNSEDKHKIYNTPDNIADMFQNIVKIQTNENTEDIDGLQPCTSKKNSLEQYQHYSEPLFNENSNEVIRKREEKKRSVSPKSKKKKAKYNKLNNVLPWQDQQTPHSSRLRNNLNSVNYVDPYENTEFPNIMGTQDNNDVKHMKNYRNSTQILKPDAPNTQDSNSEIHNYKLFATQSQCPLCFRMYPTAVIEAHASVCSI